MNTTHSNLQFQCNPPYQNPNKISSLHEISYPEQPSVLKRNKIGGNTFFWFQICTRLSTSDDDDDDDDDDDEDDLKMA